MKVISESDINYIKEHLWCSGCSGGLVIQLLEHAVTDYWEKKLYPMEIFSSADF